MGEIKLNLGSGDCPIEGYENIDHKTGQEVYPLAFDDNSVDEIRASHILEHFGQAEVQKVLEHWVSKLKSGGVIKIGVPDFKKLTELYLKGEKLPFVGIVMGGQTNVDDFHKCIFDASSLRSMMEKAGIEDISEWKSDIQDCASLPFSLNLQGKKPIEVDKIKAFLTTLVNSGSNVYSQYGEDGIIEAAFNKIGFKNKWCLEVGAADGILFSNTRRYVEQGWNAILIERDPEHYKRLVENCKAYPNAHCVLAEVGQDEPLEKYLKMFNAPNDIDLMVIDIDGQDWHLWNAMINYNPRVLVAEFDYLVDPEFIPTVGGQGQAGKEAMKRLAASKGYFGCVSTKVNWICINQSCKETLGIVDVPSSIQTLTPKIGAIMSMPRLAFTANMACVTRELPPGMDIQVVTGVFWNQIMTRLIEYHLEKGIDWLLTIDYDTYFTREHFMRLGQILAENPEIDAIAPLQMMRENNTPLFQVPNVKSGGTIQIDTSKPVIPVKSAHFGLTLLRMEKFKNLKKPWFWGQPDPNGGWNDGRVDDDIYFWNNWVASGNTVSLATDVRIGHMQLMCTWPGKPENGFSPYHQNVNSMVEKGIPEWCKL